MPNKKALRNNNRKTKRAPPKALAFSKIDQAINKLQKTRAECGGGSRCSRECPLCEQIKRKIEILRTFKKVEKTEFKTICCENPECPDNIKYQELMGCRW